MLKKCIILIFSTAFILTACHSTVYNQTMGNVADVKLKAAHARRMSDAAIVPQAPLTVKSGPYVDTTPISLDRQPSWLHNHIIIRGDQLPFSYYSRTVASGANNSVLTKYQSGLDPSINISVNYAGPIKGALDLIATKTGYVYSVRKNTIYWQAFVTRIFDISFMPGASDYLMGKKSGGGSTASQTSGGQVQNFVSSDSSDSEYSSLSATKLSVWTDLESTIKQLLSADGKASVSQATTTVTVRDKPTNVELIGQFIANLNNNLSKQVLIKVQVLEVTLQNDFSWGINWQIIHSAFHNSPFIINGAYGTPVSITSFTPQTSIAGAAIPFPQFGTIGNGKTPSYTILLNALNQQGHTSIVSEPRVVCLNNQVCVVRIVTQNGYVASVQNTTTGAGGTSTAAQNTVTSQVTPGNLITGLTLYVLPKIAGDKVFLQVNADLSTNDGFTTFGTPGTDTATSATLIQLPNITEKSFNQRSMIRSGDTLILSGLRQTTNRANANQFITSQALGGKGAQQLNKETIVLITPIVLNGCTV